MCIRDSSSDNLKWYEIGGDEISILNMSPIEEVSLNVEVSIPTGLGPGTYGLEVLASPRLPNTFEASSWLFIEVPVYHNLVIAPVRNAMLAPANGEVQNVQVFIFNEGNTRDTFDLRVDTDNWKLQAELSSDDVTLEENGGQVTVSLILPMPEMVENGTYRVSMIGTSQSDPSYQSVTNFYLTVPKTYLVEAEDRDLSEEVFAAGTDPRTLKWEIHNYGNQDDSFDIELDFPPDVNAFVSELPGGRTPYLSLIHI